jgi:hypothetical protein
LRGARRALDEAEEMAAGREAAGRSALQRLEESRRAQRDAERRRQASLDEVDTFRSRFPGVPIPTPEVLQSAARETMSPWVDEEWNRARSRLFLAALDLHRTLILC